jgi:hypothetical protein
MDPPTSKKVEDPKANAKIVALSNGPAMGDTRLSSPYSPNTPMNNIIEPTLKQAKRRLDSPLLEGTLPSCKTPQKEDSAAQTVVELALLRNAAA